MKPRTTIRTLLAAALVSVVTLVPATAWAGCTFQATPNPGWPGASVKFEGFGMSPGVTYYVNFDGNQIKTGTTNSNGYFGFNYTLPGGTSVGTHNWFAFADSGCGMNDARNYTVVASEPTTTTTSTTTTTTTTTTTIAPTTTVADTTTTVAGGDTTTTVAGGDTTTTVADTTTTTVAEEDEDGGGIPAVVLYGAIAVLAAGLFFFIGKSMSARRK